MDLTQGKNLEVDYNIEGEDKACLWDNKQFTKYLYANRQFRVISGWKHSKFS